MKVSVLHKILGLFVLLSTVAVSLIVAPFASLDPVNLPKLFLLVIVGFIAAGLTFTNFEFFKAKNNRPALLIIALFVIQLLLVFSVDNRIFPQKFYGNYGRNTGTLAYLCLSFLFLASLISASKELLKKYVSAITASGVVLSLYGLAQSKGHDFYQFDNAYGTNVFGTFGNPNFHSAFMGITASTAFTIVLFSRIKLPYKVGLFFLVSLAMYNVSLSSQQGYLNFSAGVASVILLILFKRRKYILSGIVFVGIGIGSLVVILGIFNSGPLGDLINKSSLTARGFYWRAAVKMMLEHPFFGVGMDGFGDAYLRSRTLEIAQSNLSISSDSAHNIALDIGSNGGFPLFFAYMAIIVLVLVSVVRVVKRESELDVFFIAIFSAWIAYEAQSVISINQLGLGVWGWSLSGLIIGYELNTRQKNIVIRNKFDTPEKVSVQKFSKLSAFLVIILGGAGFAIATPPYLAAGKFYRALQSGDANIIQPAAYLKPYDRARFLFVIQILQENKLEGRAIRVLMDASKIYPDSYEIWRRWSNIPSASAGAIARAKAEMKRLDPYNPNL